MDREPGGVPPGAGPARLVAIAWSRRWVVVYAALATSLLVRVGGYYHPRTGFTSLIAFGDAFAPGRLPVLDELGVHTARHSDGYDGQFYAQIAVAGNPLDPRLGTALDSPAYRARRALVPLLAHAVGLGRPAWVLNVYALANVACWLLLAAALGRWWFPPQSLHDALRWTGTLFAAGTIDSLTLSLTDGPALLLVALGVRAVEVNRRRLATVLLAAAGLARETSVLAAAALVPWTGRAGGSSRTRLTPWLLAARATVPVALPALVWVLVLSLVWGGGTGARNFDLPCAALLRKLHTIATAWWQRGFERSVRDEALATLAVITQMAFVIAAARRHFANPWWRVGAAFTALGALLGWAVWEGTPGAMTRVLLPLALAFNVLVPRTRRGLILLVLGNLSVVSAPGLFDAHLTDGGRLAHGITYDFAPGWYDGERLGRHTWRWARGSTELVFHNPAPRAYAVELGFGMSSVTGRTVVVEAGAVRRAVTLEPHRRVPLQIGPVVLPPGDTAVRFTSEDVPWTETVATARPLAFAVHDLDPAVVDAVSSPDRGGALAPVPARSP